MTAGFLWQHQRTALRFFRNFLLVYQPVNVLHIVVVLIMVTLHAGSYQQFLSQTFPFLVSKVLEGMEIGFVVFHDGLVNQHILNLGGNSVPLENQEHQGFEEVLLLTEVLGILFLCHLEGVHGDRFLLGIRDVCTFIIATNTLVGISRINHDDIGVLFKQLTYHAVHVERFTTSAWADTKEIGVVRHLDLAFLTGDVDTDGKSLTVGIVGCQRCIF